MFGITFLNDKQIAANWDLIVSKHRSNLEDKGVKLPSLRRGNSYTKNGIILVYLADGYPNTKVYTKQELTEIVQHHFSSVLDVQQGRHLGAQNGFFILNGDSRTAENELGSGEYKLISLEEPLPGFMERRRAFSGDWESLKEKYDYRCATCGSKEGERHFHFKTSIVRLQKGHMDPNEALDDGNTIPQCQICNRADQNRWKYDSSGRVIGIASIAPILTEVKRNPELGLELYKNLFKKFSGVNPNHIKK